MIVNSLQVIFKTELLKLSTEIASYQDEANLWHNENGSLNAAGNLCLHLIGNLNAYIGVGLAKTDYIRQRDLEFSLRDVPRRQLLDMIADTIAVVDRGLGMLSENDLDGTFPMVIWDGPTQTGFTLIQLATHLKYHLGQINYHRKIFDC